MKTTLSFLFLLALNQWGLAQTAPKVSRYELPVAAHYRQLATFSPVPQSASAWMDTVRFPAAKASATSIAARSLPTVYVQAFEKDLRLPPPPANSSAQTRAELDYLLRVQQTRKPEDIKQAQLMADVFYIAQLTDSSHPHYGVNVPSLFFVGKPLGDWFNAQNLPLLTRLLERVHQDASHTYYSLKYQYNRPRPYQLEPRLEPMEQAGSPSYPSSHGAASYINAYLFSELEQQLAPKFLTVAFQMAQSREVLGVDYPSDGEAARVWARSFVNYLLANPTFRGEWKAVRSEWKQVRKVHSISY